MIQNLSEPLFELVRKFMRALGLQTGEESIFIFPCRVEGETYAGKVKFRITYVIRHSRYADAEREAQNRLQQLMEMRPEDFGNPNEVRWLKGRPATRSTLVMETEAIQSLLRKLQRENLPYVSSIEKVTPSFAGLTDRLPHRTAGI